MTDTHPAKIFSASAVLLSRALNRTEVSRASPPITRLIVTLDPDRATLTGHILRSGS